MNQSANKPTCIKRLKVIKKSEAMKLAEEHEGFCSIETYCTGKYIWHGTEDVYVGREHEVSDRILALWVERRTDKDGSYALFKCLIDNN